MISELNLRNESLNKSFFWPLIFFQLSVSYKLVKLKLLLFINQINTITELPAQQKKEKVINDNILELKLI